MWIKTLTHKIRLTKVSFSIIAYLGSSLFISIVVYWGLQIGVLSLIEKMMSYSSIYESNIEEVVEDFQQYLNEHQIMIDDVEALARWNLDYYNYWIVVYDDNQWYYNSKYLWYNLNEVEKIGDAFSFTVQFQDQTAYLKIYPMFDYSFMLGVKMICGLASGIIFLVVFLVLLRRKISYVLMISKGVERMKNGELSHQIQLIGQDELSLLANNINEMSDALARQLETEKELKLKQAEMIASLSHDLRTPLTMVISYLELIQDGMYESEEQRSQYEQLIYQKATQIKDLINQLFDEVKPKPKVTYVSESRIEQADLVVEQMIHEIVSSLEMEGFHLDVRINLENSFSLPIDLQNLYRVINNLYSNILKYGNLDYSVILEAEQIEAHLRLRVSNHVKLTSELEIESHGIGLRNCQSILNRYQGKIQIFQSEQQFRIEIQIPIL